MATYDLHVHTEASPCSSAKPATILAAAERAGLDGIAVTDHDTMENVGMMREQAPPDLTVIAGTEVTTTQGHLLALGIQEPPPKTDPVSVINDVHRQGGVAVLAHPFDALRESYDDDLDQILDVVDGVEHINSRCLLPRFNDRAGSVARKRGLAVTGGSDAHFPMEVGRAYTVCTDEWSDAISGGATSAEGRGSYLSGHVATKFVQTSSQIRRS
jgi:predicted metal-dependent phosphoesterase TrpH